MPTPATLLKLAPNLIPGCRTHTKCVAPNCRRPAALFLNGVGHCQACAGRTVGKLLPAKVRS